MKFSFIVIALFGICLNLGCHKHDRQAPQGINVGNGARAASGTSVYISPYKFQFTYPAALRLRHTKDSKVVEVDNERLAHDKLRSSSIRFEVKVKGKDYLPFSPSEILDDHLPLLKKELEKTGEVKEAHFDGARGFARDAGTKEEMRTTYYVITTQLDFITIELHALEFADGLKLVAPIVKTFSFDSHPPVVHEFAPIKKLRQGIPGELRFRATDDHSGIAEFTGLCGTFQHAAGGEPGKSVPDLLVCGGITTLGDDWYSMQIEVNPFRPTGDYFLKQFYLTDRAGNQLTLEAHTDENGILVLDTYDGILRVPKAQLVGKTPVDVDPPTLHEFKPLKLEAGKKSRFEFRATDAGSGIALRQTLCGEFLPTVGKTIYDSPAGVAVCGKIADLGEDWYGIDVEVNPFRPPGEYYLANFYLEDRAKNMLSLRAESNPLYSLAAPYYRKTHIPVAKAMLVNDGRVDTKPPRIVAIRFPNPLQIGKTGVMEFRAVDDVSGIASHVTLCGSLEPMRKRVGKEDASISVCGEITSLGGAWYSVPVGVNVFRQDGEYYLSRFFLSDKADNQLMLQASVDATTNQLKEANFLETTLAVPKVQVVK